MNIMNKIKEVIEQIQILDIDNKIKALNEIKTALHNISPFSQEPVDCVIWVKSDLVVANDYNPNTVAPPEMELLKTSISEDGYTQPIVSWQKDGYNEVVDGFHRNRVGKECKEIKNRIHGYLPVTVINQSRTGRGERIASTIRHNRARGKHSVDSMSDIVVELKKRNWTEEKIAKSLGMDSDEILRLCQISGLTEMFSEVEFSDSWDINLFDDQISITENQLENLDGE